MNRTIRIYTALLAAALCAQAAYPAFAEAVNEPTETAVPADTVVVQAPAPTPTPIIADQTKVADTLPEPSDEAAEIPEVTPSPTPSPEPTNTPAPEAVKAPDETTEPVETLAPEVSAEPEETLAPEVSTEPKETIAPEVSTEPEETLAPEVSTEPEETLAPEVSTEPEETLAPEVSTEPEETLVPETSIEPEASMTPEVSAEPSPEAPEETPAPVRIEKPRRDKSIGWKGVVQSDERGMPIPMLFQYDYRKVVCYHHGQPKSVATSGCGATSVSMVVAYLTGNTQQNPYSLFFDAVERDMYSGHGLAHDTLTILAADYGVKTRWIANDADAIIAALQEGKPVIAHMGSGIFTDLGHYIVLRGVTEDGKILLNDPANRSNCTKAFPIETLINQARNSTSFMVCWVDEMPAPTPSATPEN